MKNERLAIANEHGSVNVKRMNLGKRYVHIEGKCLQPLCRKLGIRFADALIGFKRSRAVGWRPVKNGVVVSAQSAPKLLAEIEAQNVRVANRQPKQKAFNQNDTPTKKPNQSGRRRSHRRLLRLVEKGDGSVFEFQLNDFIQNYRSEHDIPRIWDSYLAAYPFPEKEIAKAISRVLKKAEDAHPIWFCEAVLAVKRAQLDLSRLCYSSIRAAIYKWRNDRSKR